MTFPDCAVLYSPAFVVVRWKNTLFLSIDGCFKLKLKERGFVDPDLSAGLAYIVEDVAYQKHLSTNPNATDPVSFRHILRRPIAHRYDYGTDLYLWSGASRG